MTCENEEEEDGWIGILEFMDARGTVEENELDPPWETPRLMDGFIQQ